ncbi:hypothetical protein VTK56DRAFT_8743 [Thermocarpiscus australiensis]
MAAPVSLQQRMGRIVAFEGPSELVSTQLRLLPASPQVLILPSLEHYMEKGSPELPFDARQLIHRFHTAAEARHAEALGFLRTPMTGDEMRVVFLHGGTVAAHVACLSAILEHQPDGSIDGANATFSRVVSHGIAGLLPDWPSSCRTSMLDAEERVDCGLPDAVVSKGEQDGKQISWGGYVSHEDGTIEDPIMRAMRAADALDKETEFLQPTSQGVDLTVKLIDIPPRGKKSMSSETLRGPRLPFLTNAHAQKGVSPAEDTPYVTGDTASTAGEPASATIRRPPLRIRVPSPPIPWAGDVAVRAYRQFSSKTQHSQYPTPQSLHQREVQTTGTRFTAWQEPTGNKGAQLDTVGMPAVRLHGLPVLGKEGERGSQEEWAAPSPIEPGEQPFEVVLPLHEDLIVRFSDETPDELMDSVCKRLRDDVYNDRVAASQPATPAQDAAFRGTSAGGHVGSGKAPWMRKALVHGPPTPGESPTPSDTEPTATPELHKCFYTLSVGRQTAVSLQNSLRSLLASHFPLQDCGYVASGLADLRDGVSLWKPLECDAGRLASSDRERRVDLILAVGAESSVKKTRVSEVVGQLEKLGFKASGLSRSGRLELRYLIANAMQAFTAQPLTKQTQSNPFADRTLLAALLIPHLETYLSMHPNVRFLLIEYPAEHLATVLALQSYIGSELMKVVGIINSDRSSLAQPFAAPSPPETQPWPVTHFREDFRAVNPQEAVLGSSSSFSKANFLLASSAAGWETAAFIAAIRESLISISDFYIPEGPLYKPASVHSPPGPAHPSAVGLNELNTKPPSFRRHQVTPSISASTSLITPPSSPTESSSATGLRHPAYRAGPGTKTGTGGSSPPPISYPETQGRQGGAIPLSLSPVFLIRKEDSNRDNTSRGARRAASQRERLGWGQVGYGHSYGCGYGYGYSHGPLDWDGNRHRRDTNGYSLRGEQELSALAGDRGMARNMIKTGKGGYAEEEDDEERRLMPMYLRRRAEKGSSQKALRWLGLV